MSLKSNLFTYLFIFKYIFYQFNVCMFNEVTNEDGGNSDLTF
jgi:hypothetical protein